MISLLGELVRSIISCVVDVFAVVVDGRVEAGWLDPDRQTETCGALRASGTGTVILALSRAQMKLCLASARVRLDAELVIG